MQLGNLEEFALAVFNRLWRAIRKMYSTCRKIPPVNKFRIEQARQQSLIHAYIQPLILKETGSQFHLLTKLADFADFLLETESPVAVVCGGHGSGKSTVMAKLIYDSESFPKDIAGPLDRFDSAQSHRMLRTKLMRHLDDLKTAIYTAETGPGSSNSGWTAADFSKKSVLSTRAGDSFMDGLSKLGLRNSASGTDELLKQRLELLSKSDFSSQLWQLRLEIPRVVYFFKAAAHDTLDVISYLCSALKGMQDTALATWHRVEELIRENVSMSRVGRGGRFKNVPLLLILDGLNETEREHMCRITVSFRGSVRVVMTVDSTRIGQSVKGKGTGWQWNGCTVLWNGPLHIEERKEMLSAMIDRLGPRKIPAILDTFIVRPCCGDPIYLSTVCAYFRMCIDMSIPPASISKLSYSAVDILVEYMFPTVENLVGRDAVLWYLEIVSGEPSGKLKADVELLMNTCQIPINNDALKILTIAFRPLSDPGLRVATERICLNRTYVKQAIFERYYCRPLVHKAQCQGDPEHYLPQKSEDGILFNPIGRSASLTSIPGMMSDKDTEDGEENWLSEDDSINGTGENSDNKGLDAHVDSPNSNQEFECWFGSVMLMCNKALFEKFCSTGSLTSTGEFHRRSKTMDLNELLHLLRFTCIFPNHISKGEVIKAFKIANRNARKQWVYDITIQNTLVDSDHGLNSRLPRLLLVLIAFLTVSYR